MNEEDEIKVHNYMGGEPEVLRENTFVRHVCCDCGLVHGRLIEKARGGKVVIRWYRDDWSTQKERRKRKKK